MPALLLRLLVCMQPKQGTCCCWPSNACSACGAAARLQLAIHVTATVMPRNKGTPGLKPSVHCVGFTHDTDTEAASDWQGFD